MNLRQATLALVATVSVVALGVDSIAAKAAWVPLDRKVAESDFIGVVRILDTQTLRDTVESDSNWPYQRLARAKVLRSLKGPPAGAILDLEFDNGLICPNAVYSSEAEYLVFWGAIGAGRYATYAFYFGMFLLEDQHINGWEKSWDQPTKLTAAMAEIQKHLAREKSAP